MAKRRRQQRPRAGRPAGTRQGPAPAPQRGQPPPSSWRDRLPIGLRPAAPGRKRRVSRREREERRQRQLYWGMGIAGVLIVAILAGFSINEYYIKPNHVLATVDGTKIRRKDYWKVRSYDLLNQASQFSQLAQFADSSQRSQYQSMAQQALNELKDVWGSTNTDGATLSRMIDDQVYLKHLGDLNLSITDQELADYIAQQFEPADAPIYTPTPTQTLIPTRAAWATETAVARTATAIGDAAAPVASPEIEASPGAASPIATPEPSPAGSELPVAQASSAEGASPEASPIASPSGSGSPEASPTASPTVAPTPNQEEARQTAAAGYKRFQDNVFGETHLSRSDYERLIARPQLARQKVREALESQIGQSAEQIHAGHILVATKDLADSIYQQLQQPGAEFEQIAKDQSTDSSTAPNGGDLGWFPRGIMVPAFDAVAFATQPGQISQPFETQFGWHIVKVYASEPDRPLTDDEISQLKTNAVQRWLEEQRAASDISSEITPTPTPTGQQFEPPPDAPPTPTPTPTPLASPVASPLASPEGSPQASPVAS
jgi:hypothetical protein